MTTGNPAGTRRVRTGMSRQTSRVRTLLVVPLVVLSGLTACGADDDGAERASDDTSTSPTGTATSEPGAGDAGTLALTADGAAAAKCAVPIPDTLATFDTAFAGTVTALDGGTATLSVDEWYAGGDGAQTVTVTSPSEQLQDLLLAVDFQEGRSYLVSADGDRVTLCGYSGEDNAEMQALYDEAFGA